MTSLLITGSGSKFTGPLLHRLTSRFKSITLLSKNSPNRFTLANVRGLNFDLSLSHKIPVQADVVIHLAASVPYNQNSVLLEDVVNTNIRCFINIMRYAISNGVQHVVFASSTDIFPLIVSEPICPKTIPIPHNEYGLSKLACERIGQTMSEIYSIPLSILRIGPIYSEDNPKANRISAILDELKQNKSITISEPRNIPSLLHIESVADAMTAALAVPGGKFLIAGHPISIGDFISMAKDAYNSFSEISFTSRSSQSVNISFDLTESENALKWSPFSNEMMFRAVSKISKGVQ